MQDSTLLSGKIMDRLAALRNGSPPGGADAGALSLKRNTVRNYVARLCAKIGAHNLVVAII